MHWRYAYFFHQFSAHRSLSVFAILNVATWEAPTIWMHLALGTSSRKQNGSVLD
jgi:hypothetical protein